MNSATSILLQSKFFTPVFNTAIFDGPVRVYFAQHQEPDALKMYFKLQDVFGKMKVNFKEKISDVGHAESNIFVMLYPNSETFYQSFEVEGETAMEKLGSNYVLGVRGPLKEDVCDRLLNQIEVILEGWQKKGTA